MEALQVFPVLISNIPRNWQVEQLYDHVLAAYIDRSLHHNVLFYSPFIDDADGTWLLVLKCMTAQFDLIHCVHKATASDARNCNPRLGASLPARPHFERAMPASSVAQLDCVQHYRFIDNQSMSSASYTLCNCVCIQLAVAHGHRWCLLPVHAAMHMAEQPHWHLVICVKSALKERIKLDARIQLFSIKATPNFHGFIADAQQMKQQPHVHRNLVENASVGFIRNTHWNCDHCFELKNAFVHSRSKLAHKKAIFNVCLAQAAVTRQAQARANYLQLRPDRDCFVKNVRIEMSASMVNRQIQTHQNTISALSRFVDVRSWSRADICEFLQVCANGKYQEAFLMHNLRGKRLECLTLDWLVYCSVDADDAKEIIKCKSFFLQCAHIVEEYEMNKGYHIKRTTHAIGGKIEQLNELLTECVSMTYVCQHRQCRVFLSRYQQLYAYINAYVHDLRLRIQAHDASEGVAHNHRQPIKKSHLLPTPKNLQILIESHNDLLRDYAAFTHSNEDGNTGCILVRMENIHFVACIYGRECVQRAITAMERQLIEASTRCCVRDRGRSKLHIYKKQFSEFAFEYVVLVSPQVTAQQFEHACQAFAKLQFEIPHKWTPQTLQTISDNFGFRAAYAHEHKLQPLSLPRLKYDAHNFSPSKEIEGRPKKKRKQSKTEQKMHNKKSSIVHSLSKFVKHKKAAKAMSY